MKVLVTGGAGYIGSHACKALARAGHVPVVYDNLRSGHRWAVKYGPFEHGDILDGDRLQAVLRDHQIEAVMHFAALAYVGESVTKPDIYYRTNVVGTLSLLNAMHATGVGRLVFSSSCATYGNRDTDISETDSQAPINPYGRSKLMGEQMLGDFVAAYGLGAVIFRYFNAAGSDPEGELGEEHDPETHLIPLVLEVAAGEREAVSIFGTDYDTPDGTCIRDYVHVTDLADAHIRALDAIRPGQQRAYNLGAGRGYSVQQVIEAAKQVTGRPIASRAAPRRAGDPPSLVATGSLARSELGWVPGHSDLQTMIETAWHWKTTHRHQGAL
jgi:UDP-arabinose 4-epimerase